MKPITNVRFSKYLSDAFPIQNGLKQGNALSPLVFNFHQEGSRKPREIAVEWASALC
jgi:hypothetical protein